MCVNSCSLWNILLFIWNCMIMLCIHVKFVVKISLTFQYWIDTNQSIIMILFLGVNYVVKHFDALVVCPYIPHFMNGKESISVDSVLKFLVNTMISLITLINIHLTNRFYVAYVKKLSRLLKVKWIIISFIRVKMTTMCRAVYVKWGMQIVIPSSNMLSVPNI